MPQAPRKRINKSLAVREELGRSETGSPSEIVATLAKKGIEVSAAFVSNIKTQEKKKEGAVTRQGLELAQALANRGSRRGAVSEQELQVASELILKAIDLLLEVGQKKAHQLIDRADEMVKRISARGPTK
jgi:hypothetical protein